MNVQLRLAVVGQSPCGECVAACCKRWGPEFAVLLRGDEARRFAAFSVGVRMRRSDGRMVVERVLPYLPNGRCQFLSDDDRCSIYADRPAACREFQCTEQFNTRGIGLHGEFLVRNADVVQLLMKTGGRNDEGRTQNDESSSNDEC